MKQQQRYVSSLLEILSRVLVTLDAGLARGVDSLNMKRAELLLPFIIAIKSYSDNNTS
jgi:hypothetical protein